MPALSLIESRSAVLIQTLVPVTPGVCSMLMPEDYLLVHSCTASATRQTLRKVNNDGEIYFRADYDLQIFFDIEAEMLSPYGLANWHPGAKLTTNANGTLPALACANARTDLFRASGGVDFYENPKLTFLPGDLPGVSFRIARENASVASGLGDPPAVDDVTVITFPPSTPPAGTDFEDLYEVSTIWVRRLNLYGPVTRYQGSYYQNVDVWFTLPDSTPAPADLAAFNALPTTGVSVPGENEIIEVVTTAAPGGTYLKGGDESRVILDKLESGNPIPEPLSWNFLYGYIIPDSSPVTYARTGGYSATATTAEEFIAEMQALAGVGDIGNQINGNTVVEVYSVHQAVWLMPVYTP